MAWRFRPMLALAAGVLACGGKGLEGEGEAADASAPDAMVGPDAAAEPDGPPEAGPSECPVTSIGGGVFHECAVRSDGTVACWGWNGEGQLGDGTLLDHDSPVAVTGISDAVEVAGGLSHTCARKRDGAVACWGRGLEGQIGGYFSSSKLPTAVTGLPGTAAGLAAGNYHTCARLGDGRAACWGAGTDGQQGDGSGKSFYTPQVVAALGADVAQVSAGSYHTCARKTDGTLWCWGYNGGGALGDSTFDNRMIPVQVTDLGDGVAEVAASGSHTCALTKGAGVFCWGNGVRGAIGDGSGGFSPIPVPVTVGPLGIARVDKLWSLGDGVCARKSNGSVWCWGRNELGQLGDGGDENRFKPGRVEGIGRDVVQIAGGNAHGCLLDRGGRVACSGSGGYGQLGDGRAVAASPVAVPVPGGAVAAAGAGELHGCATGADGTTSCWGANDIGQLGDGTLSQRPSPTAVDGLGGAGTRFGLGISHSCARRADGTLWCWGNNFNGQLGDGTTSYRVRPVQVKLVENHVVDVSAGESHTCALLEGGNVGCWGNNRAGELGDGTRTSHRTPYQVAKLGFDVAAIAAGGHHSCAIKTDGSLWCWGANYLGEVGDGSAKTQIEPVLVAGVTGRFSEVVAGYYFGCARRDDGGAFCWGDNRVGQQGKGEIDFDFTTHEVATLRGSVARLAAGREHACALITDGRVFCWGEGRYGQLGDGARVTRATPVEVKGLPGPAVAVMAGARHSCALGADAVLRCWGWNGDGQIGDGKGGHRNLHAPVALCP